jgi:hypothetical protein
MDIKPPVTMGSGGERKLNTPTIVLSYLEPKREIMIEVVFSVKP